MGSDPRDRGSWWAIVGLYFYLVGNCPQWAVVLEPFKISLCSTVFSRNGRWWTRSMCASGGPTRWPVPRSRWVYSCTRWTARATCWTLRAWPTLGTVAWAACMDQVCISRSPPPPHTHIHRQTHKERQYKELLAGLQELDQPSGQWHGRHVWIRCVYLVVPPPPQHTHTHTQTNPHR